MIPNRVKALAYFSNTTQNNHHLEWGVREFGTVRHAHDFMCLPNESVFMVPHFDYGKDVR